MTTDEAKYELHLKIQVIKRLLRDRSIEVTMDRTGSKVLLNGFHSTETFKNFILYTEFRDMISRIEYVYMCELDDLKRKKLALYVIMQFSFKEHKYIGNYYPLYETLDTRQKKELSLLEAAQENIRQDIIQSLKSDYLRDNANSINIKDLKKITWQGNRKQLAELLVELEDKKWILINEGNRKAVCDTVTLLFDIAGKEKDETINSSSFYTTFRPDPTMNPHKVSYQMRYQKIYTTLYKPKFELIEKSS